MQVKQVYVAVVFQDEPAGEWALPIALFVHPDEAREYIERKQEEYRTPLRTREVTLDRHISIAMSPGRPPEFER